MKELEKELPELLDLMGLPSWPPKETPPVTDWYKHPQVIYPSKFLYPGIVTIDVGGTPKAGKSTLRESLITKLGDSYRFGAHTWRVHDWDEQYVSASPANALAIGRLLSTAALPGIDDDDLNLAVLLDRDWTTPLFQQNSKVSWWNFHFDQLLRAWGPQKYELVLGYRGPIDNLVWFYALASHKSDPLFTIPEDFIPLLTPSLISTLPQIRSVSATVLMGSQQSVAQTRRQDDPRPGWVSGSRFYADLQAWYGYFIEKVIPGFHQDFGLGLLVQNGEDSVKNNFDNVINYLDKICNADKSRLT